MNDQLDEVIELLNEQARVQAEFRAEIRGHLKALQPVISDIHVSLTTLEETSEVIARDATQARTTGHRIRDLLAPLCVCVETLLELAEGKRPGTSATSAHAQLAEALDAQR